MPKYSFSHIDVPLGEYVFQYQGQYGCGLWLVMVSVRTPLTFPQECTLPRRHVTLDVIQKIKWTD